MRPADIVERAAAREPILLPIIHYGEDREAQGIAKERRRLLPFLRCPCGRPASGFHPNGTPECIDGDCEAAALALGEQQGPDAA